MTETDQPFGPEFKHGNSGPPASGVGNGGSAEKSQDGSGLPPGHGGADGDPNTEGRGDSTIMSILDWLFGVR